MTKYKNTKITTDGIKFDSKLEYKRYVELTLLQKAGKIQDLKIHPEFEIFPEFKKHGKTYRRTLYIADFSYFDVTANKYVIEDTKGVKTAVYSLKKKMFEYKYPWKITEIRR